MKSILILAAASLTIAISGSAFAQSSIAPVSDPNVRALLGDIDSKKARKAFRRKIKKSPKKKQCRAAEWEKLGFRHAYRGWPVAKGVAEATKRCVDKHDVSFDQSRYEAGHREGVIMYCGYERGVRIGGRGTDPTEGGILQRSFCGQGLFPTFDIGHRVGEKLDEMQTEMYNLREAIPEAQAAFDAYYAEVVDGDRSFEVRRKLGELERDIENAKNALRVAQVHQRLPEKIEAFETKYNAGKYIALDLPDDELEYEIPTYP